MGDGPSDPVIHSPAPIRLPGSKAALLWWARLHLDETENTRPHFPDDPISSFPTPFPHFPHFSFLKAVLVRVWLEPSLARAHLTLEINPCVAQLGQ